MDFGPHPIYDCMNAIWNTFAMANRYIIRDEEWTQLVVLLLVIGQTGGSIRPQSALMCRLSQGFWHPRTGPSQQVLSLRDSIREWCHIVSVSCRQTANSSTYTSHYHSQAIIPLMLISPQWYELEMPPQYKSKNVLKTF